MDVSAIIRGLLNQIFVHKNNYRGFDIVRVVGWAPSAIKPNVKARYVFVEYITISKDEVSYTNDGKEVNLSINELKNLPEPLINPIISQNKLKFVLLNRQIVLTKGNPRLPNFEMYLPVDESSQDNADIVKERYVEY